MRNLLFRQAFRLYGIVTLLLGVWTYVWTTGAVRASPTAVGGAWYVLAALGAALAVGLLATRSTTLSADGDGERMERFSDDPLGRVGIPLYAGVLVAWTGITVGWWAMEGAVVAPTTLGIGWYAVAAFGAAIGTGLFVTTVWRPAIVAKGSPMGDRS